MVPGCFLRRVPGGNSAHQYKRIADELLNGINGAGAALLRIGASAGSASDQAGVVRTFQAFSDSNWDKLATRAGF